MTQDAQDFLSTLLELRAEYDAETRDEYDAETRDENEETEQDFSDSTIWHFHPDFVSAVEDFLSGFRNWLFLQREAEELEELDPDTRGNYGHDVLLSLNGSGAGFWDSPETEAIQPYLEKFAGSRYRLEGLEHELFIHEDEQIHLDRMDETGLNERLAQLFRPAALVELEAANA